MVQARQRARQISSLLGFSQQDQTRVATAVSELARNAYQYARGCRVEFSVDLVSSPQMLWVQVSDTGPGIRDLEAILRGEYKSSTGMGLGLVGTKRLMDEFEIESTARSGTTVWIGKALPNGQTHERGIVGQLSVSLAQQRPIGPDQELERQSKELLIALDSLRVREVEVERRKQELARLSLELEETNRGVVALYAELDDKAAELRQADEIRARFLSHVSHEFRTPVNSVLALTRLLLQRADGELTAEQERQVGYIREAAQQLADMVNDLLDLAKVDSGKTEIRTSRVDIGQFFGAIRALMKPLATQEAVTLIFDEPEPGLHIDTDEGKLAQILRNLISNALKFTSEGEVRVGASRVQDGSQLWFTVRDTGIGIAQEDQERIFQEFAQIDSPLQRRVKGTGLGLPLSRRLAELLGGKLTLESQPGLGSTFMLTLPEAAHGTSRSLDESGVESRRPSIMIVDDDATARYLVKHLFRASRYNIIETDGAEAAERARFESPALIFLDLIMPERSGFEVLRELKSHEDTRDIPVVIHSSKSLNDADYALLAGLPLAVLPKGATNRKTALSAIRRALGDDTLFRTEPEFDASERT
jgi:signal transduction histidine kinase/ActR/RegA family two-component response regulator